MCSSFAVGGITTVVAAKSNAAKPSVIRNVLVMHHRRTSFLMTACNNGLKLVRYVGDMKMIYKQPPPAGSRIELTEEARRDEPLAIRLTLRSRHLHIQLF